MKKFSFICLVFLGFLASCGEEKIKVEEDLTEILEIDSAGISNADITHQGEFVSDAHPTSGIAQVVMSENGQKTIVFTEFQSDSGPDLDVYLATGTDGKDFINLGDLKGTEGQFTYELPDNVDLDKYNHVLIWCVQFSVNFGYAKIE